MSKSVKFKQLLTKSNSNTYSAGPPSTCHHRATTVPPPCHHRASTCHHRAKAVPAFASTCPELFQDGSRLAPRWPKDGQRLPNMAQDGPKMVPRGPKMAPSWPQDGPKMAPEGFKMAPRWPKMDPRTTHKPLKTLGKVNTLAYPMLLDSKMAPRGPKKPQDGPKMAQDGPTNDPQTIKNTWENQYFGLSDAS